MDNNMIHIDDLVRQRLRGGEEPERPGAWLSMRDLLDKEMPVATSSNHWRRIFGYFTAALLFTTATVGGYRMYNSQLAPGGMTAGGGGRSEVGMNTAATGLASKPATNNNSVVTANTTSNTASSTPSSANNTAPTTQSDNTSGNYVAANAAKPSGTSRTSAGITTNGSTATTTERQDPSSSAVSAASNGGTANAQATSSEPKPGTAPNQQSSDRIYASANGANVNGRRMQKAPENLDAAAVAGMETAGLSAGTANPTTKPAPIAIKYETVERLELVHRKVYDAGTDKTYYRIDTVPMGKFIRETIIAKSEPETIAATTETPAKPEKRSGLFNRERKSNKAAAAGTSTPAIAAKGSAAPAAASRKQSLNEVSAPIVPASSVAARTTEEQVGSGIAALGTESIKQRGFRLWNAEKFEMAVEKVKHKVSGIEMYPGIMGGINASMFTQNALGGFQLGLTTLFVLNDWWSLMIEPKYILRYNTGSSLRDDYKEVIDNSGKIQATTYMGKDYWSYTWTDHTIQHNFNYNTISTIEVPVMARYHWNQIYMQGGANLVFSSAIKAQEVTRPLGDYENHSELRPRLPNSTPGTFIDNSKPNVQMSDFGSRFGVGYVLSGGYMFSPSVYFDLRLVQTVWDNSKTRGAKQVSNDLLKTPSVQLSVGYRLNSKK